MHRTAARTLAALSSALLVVGLAACGDDDDTGAEEPTGEDSDSAGDGTITAADFSLTSITVGPGDEVTVENGGEKPHTVTADGDEFDSGEAAPGGSASFTAPDEPGTYDFHCSIHDSMTGTLTVEA